MTEFPTQQIIHFWFKNQKFWFDSTPEFDLEIGSLFGHLVNKTHAYFYSDEYPVEKHILAFILVYDQFPRHIYRYDSKLRISYDDLALQLTLYAIESGYDIPLTPEQRCFLLMPLRHTFNILYLQLALDKIKEYRQTSQDPIYTRFYRATLLSLGRLLNSSSSPVQTNENISVESLRRVLSESNNSLDWQICSTLKHSKMSLLTDNYLYQEFDRFLKDSLLGNSRSPKNSLLGNSRSPKNSLLGNSRSPKDSLLGNSRSPKDSLLGSRSPKDSLLGNNLELSNPNQDQDQKQIIISLSGGVDSMVCSWLLMHFKHKYNYSYEVVAVSIDYANREESYLEAEMVVRWCQQVLSIPCYVRRINEISRSRDRDRELYEEVTKEIRYGMYHVVSRLSNLHPTEGSQKSIVPTVVLGHNADDCLENILTNVKNRTNYDNLFGMKSTFEDSSCQERPQGTLGYFADQGKITIWRPLLQVPKSQIFEFAHNLGIPYTLDSTPKWSQRGRMRHELIPSMNSYDPNLLTGLKDLSTNLAQINSIFEKEIMTKIIESIKYFHEPLQDAPGCYADQGASRKDLGCFAGKNKCVIPLTQSLREYPLFIWRRIFEHICRNFKVGYPSNKALNSLMHKLQLNSVCIRVTLKKCYYAYIKDNQLILVISK